MKKRRKIKSWRADRKGRRREKGLFEQLAELVRKGGAEPVQGAFRVCAGNALPMPFSPAVLPGARKPE